MTRFNKQHYGPLRTERIGPRRWRVIENWHTPYAVVKAGFESDGVSSGALRPLASPGGSMFEAAILHDYLYVNAINHKAYADQAFLQTALAFGVVYVRAFAAYLLCAAFGRGAYAKTR